jgi:ABC exporter DevB family membrane fusion protein
MQVPLSLREHWPARLSRRWWAVAAAAVVLVAGMVWAARGGSRDAAGAATGAAAEPGAGEAVLACTARVEGASETTQVGAGVDGVVAEIRVKEGDAVQAGDVLAVIDRRELPADLNAARATAEAARQARKRVMRGSRQEDRERAEAEVIAAEAVVAQAQSEHERAVRLFQQGILTASARDEARRNLEVSQAQRQAARKRADLVKAPPLPEEAAKADADVRAVEERVRSLEQMLQKTYIRAPTSGTVLRTLMRPGESFSTFVPRPIVSMADTSRLRVRAEVDERDVAKVHAGQRVLVRGDGWAGESLPGRVSRLGAEMGRKRVRTGDPAEKSDRDVLEVLVDLDRQDPRLVVGLRVTALFLKDAGPAAASTPPPAR